MAGAFLVTLDKTKSGQTYREGVDTILCWAEDAAGAIDIAQSQQEGSAASDAAWAAATATAVAATADYEGWRLRVTVVGPPAGDLDITYTGIGSDSMNDMGDAMVLLMNATTDIANSAYSTPTLTLSSIADGNGDDTVTVELFPPLADGDFPQNTVPFASYIGAIVHEGIAGAVLTVVLEPGFPVPTLLNRLKQ